MASFAGGIRVLGNETSIPYKRCGCEAASTAGDVIEIVMLAATSCLTNVSAM